MHRWDALKSEKKIYVQGSKESTEISVLNKNNTAMTDQKVRWIFKRTNYAEKKKVSDSSTESAGFESGKETNQIQSKAHGYEPCFLQDGSRTPGGRTNSQFSAAVNS